MFELSIEVGSIGSNPHSTPSLGDIIRVDVYASDHISCRRVEHGVGESLTSIELLAVLSEVSQVLFERHRVRPIVSAPLICPEAWSCSNVLDARRPGCEVGDIVLGSERLEYEDVSFEASGRVFPHDSKITRRGVRDADRRCVAVSASRVVHATLSDVPDSRASLATASARPSTPRMR